MQLRNSTEEAGSPEPEKRYQGSLSKTHRFAAPTIEDGADIYRLVERGGTLDLNSAYCYLLMGAHFAATSVVARDGERVVGFVSAYRVPAQPEALFVWQVGVAPEARGSGIASAMLDHILGRRICAEVRYLEATVTPSNAPSRALFESFAKRHNARLVTSAMFSTTHFPGGQHEEEILLRIGPFDQSTQQGEAL